MDWEGTIPEGTYGAGPVELADRAKTEVTNARPGHISFNVYRGSGPEEYTLHQLPRGKTWKLLNRTLERTTHHGLPDSKPKYKETPIEKVDVNDDRFLLSAKIDDAHNLFLLPTGQTVRAISYRRGKRRGVIEHTHKVPTLMDGVRTPKELGGTILRGGLYARNPKTEEATPTKDLVTLLNSNVWKSRERQKELGPLIPTLYDVVQYRGKNVEHAPYLEKMRIIDRVRKALPKVFETPEVAYTPEEKQYLLDRIIKRDLPETTEGVVLWNVKEPDQKPIKAKILTDFDVYIRDFFPGKGQYEGKGVGGFFFSHTEDGPISGRVGTGLSRAQRVDMYENPEKYFGTVARVKAQEKFPSEALRAPAFKGFHLDKNPQQTLDMLKHASQSPDSVWSSLLFEPVFQFAWGEAIA
jgi:hypothetical protein